MSWNAHNCERLTRVVLVRLAFNGFLMFSNIFRTRGSSKKAWTGFSINAKAFVHLRYSDTLKNPLPFGKFPMLKKAVTMVISSAR